MPQHPNDILHYYRLASQQAALAQTPEEEAAAYRQVVDFARTAGFAGWMTALNAIRSCFGLTTTSAMRC